MSFMEVLMPRPLNTPLGRLIEQATDGGLLREDWSMILEICDIVNETEDGPRDALRALKRRLGGGANKNTREVMLALTVLESCMKNCGHRFHVLAASRDFVEGSLVRLILPRSCPTPALRARVLRLLQAWADAFRSSADLTGVAQVYEALKRKGVEFPPPIAQETETPSWDETLSQPCGPRPDLPVSWGSTAVPSDGLQPPVDETRAIGVMRGRPLIVAAQRAARDLTAALRSTQPGVPLAPSGWEHLQALAARCGTFRRRVHELVSEAVEQQETEQLLALNDELNRALLQHESYCQAHVGTGEHSSGTAPASLGESELSVATDDGNVWADDLAHSRVTEDLRMRAFAERLEAVTEAWLLPVHLEPIDIWLASQNMIPLAQPSFMDDIEKWLNSDVKGDVEDEGDTTEEFERFLGRRARAVKSDRPSGPSTLPIGDARTRQPPSHDTK
ncbi:TOM1-like protein 2 [Lampetra fluviatilis]